MKTKGNIEQKIAKLERSIRKFGSTDLKEEALMHLKSAKRNKNGTR